MSTIQLNTSNHTQLENFELPQNYSILINKLERLALDLDVAFNNLSSEIAGGNSVVAANIASLGGGGGDNENGLFGFNDDNSIKTIHAPPPPTSYNTQMQGPFGISRNSVEYPRVISDIWIGVILTLLIFSVIFFICSCFLYHKFQQWKSSYRTSATTEPVELCHRYPTDFEVETLPSYTIVSGLPTYDDALEEFRKAGIILTPAAALPIRNLFDQDIKDGNAVIDLQDMGKFNNNDSKGGNEQENDNISVNSFCVCGAANSRANNNSAKIPTNAYNTPNGSVASRASRTKLYSKNNTFALIPGTSGAIFAATPRNKQIIELTPEQLAVLSQKRLSLQIAFHNSPTAIRRGGSRQRVDLYREVNRNNLLRSNAYASNDGLNFNVPKRSDAESHPTSSSTYSSAETPTLSRRSQFSPNVAMPLGMHRSFSSTSINRNSENRTPWDYLQQHRCSLY